MKVIAEKNNIELGAIVLSHVLWMIPIAGGLYIELKFNLGGVASAPCFAMGVFLFIFSILYTIYFCSMPKTILSINSNYELILPHNRVIPLSHVEKMQVKVYGRRMVEIYPPSGLLIIQTASKTYRYYFIKDPDDVQEKLTLFLHEYRQHKLQYDNCEPII